MGCSATDVDRSLGIQAEYKILFPFPQTECPIYEIEEVGSSCLFSGPRSIQVLTQIGPATPGQMRKIHPQFWHLKHILRMWLTFTTTEFWPKQKGALSPGFLNQSHDYCCHIRTLHSYKMYFWISLIKSWLHIFMGVNFGVEGCEPWFLHQEVSGLYYIIMHFYPVSG